MDEQNKLILPAIAIRGLVPLPNVDFRIEVGRDISINALKKLPFIPEMFFSKLYCFCAPCFLNTI